MTGQALTSLAITVPWFLLGYSLYATLFAMAGALVPKIEDLQSVIMIPVFTLVGSFFLAQFANTDPGGTPALVSAILPFSRNRIKVRDALSHGRRS